MHNKQSDCYGREAVIRRFALSGWAFRVERRRTPGVSGAAGGRLERGGRREEAGASKLRAADR